MTEKGVAQIITLMQTYYPNYKVADVESTVKAWHLVIGDYDYKSMQDALLGYVTTDTSGFPPSIGQLIQVVNTQNPEPELMVTPLEAWDMVYKAISDSSYHAEQRFNDLPPLVQKAVGSPSQLKSWAVDDNFNMGVAQSQFIRVYNNVIDREKQIQKMPVNIRPESSLGVKQSIAIEDKWSPISGDAYKEGYVPENLHERLRDMGLGM